MDTNLYLVEWWAKERLDEHRAAAVRAKLVASLRGRRRLRVTLAVALISLGRRVEAGAA
jgi:hypothetical protein